MKMEIMKFEIEKKDTKNGFEIGLSVGFERDFVNSLTEDEEIEIQRHAKKIAEVIEKSIKRQVKENMREVEELEELKKDILDFLDIDEDVLNDREKFKNAIIEKTKEVLAELAK